MFTKFLTLWRVIERREERERAFKTQHSGDDCLLAHKGAEERDKKFQF